VILYIDTETHLIGPGNIAPRPVCVQVAVDDSAVEILPLWESRAPEQLCALFRMTDVVVGHNVAYDFLCLIRHMEHSVLEHTIWELYDTSRVADTMVRQKLRDIASGAMKIWRKKGYSLARLAERYGDTKNADDPWRLRYGELEGILPQDWPDAALKYARHDVEATRAVYLAQGDPVADEENQTRAAWWLHIVSDAGIWTAPDRIRALEDQEAAAYAEDLAYLQAEGLVRTNGQRDTKAARARMLDCGVDRQTAKGAVSLDLEACQQSGDPALLAYARLGSRKTLLKRISDLWLGVNTPINPRYDSLVETGRTSCIRGKTVPEGGATNSAQLQNMPRSLGVRECFRPRAGEVVISCDYSGMELCTWAQICLWLLGHSDLAVALNNGIDPHLDLGAQLLRITYDEAVQRRGDQDVADARQAAKAANFGFPGGLGAGGFRAYAASQWGLVLSEGEAYSLKTTWTARWREAPHYFRWVDRGHRWAGVEKKMTTVTQYPSRRIRGGCTYTVACNTQFQGLAADAAKAAGYALAKACELGDLRTWKVWNFVHDEFLLRGPAHDADRAARVVQSIMETEAARWIPDVPPKAEPVVSGVWSKAAKQVFDARGRLIPWRPSES